MRTFVDTNVFVYAVDQHDPAKQQRAREVLTSDPDNLVVSAQVLGEVYVTLTRKLPQPMAPAEARSVVMKIARTHVVPIDTQVVAAGLALTEGGRVSYWDALIVAAAGAAGCERLLTEDLTAGTVIGGVRVENPFEERRRLSETSAPYGRDPGPWSDGALVDALAAYEKACLDAGMRPNAVHSYWDYARRFLDWRTGEYRPRGAAPEGRPTPTEPVSAANLRLQATAYADAIRAAGREPATVDTYHRHAMFFVRWLAGEFHPGERLRKSGSTEA